MTTKERCAFWLSFSDPDAPRGKWFLGVAIVDMDTDASAVEIIRHTWRLGINPGELSQSHNLMTGAHWASQESTETS
jgi:hypothetical protein